MATGGFVNKTATINREVAVRILAEGLGVPRSQLGTVTVEISTNGADFTLSWRESINSKGSPVFRGERD